VGTGPPGNSVPGSWVRRDKTRFSFSLLPPLKPSRRRLRTPCRGGWRDERPHSHIVGRTGERLTTGVLGESRVGYIHKVSPPALFFTSASPSALPYCPAARPCRFLQSAALSYAVRAPERLEDAVRRWGASNLESPLLDAKVRMLASVCTISWARERIFLFESYEL